MYLHLKELLRLLPTNPKMITQVEEEVERIIKEENCNYLLEAFKIDEHNIRFYVLVILEKKMQLLRESNASFSEMICFSEVLLNNYELKSIDAIKLAKINAKLGLYEWPNTYPNFFNILSELITNKKRIGYLILENFLYFMHNSLEIDENRRNELKRAMVLLKDTIIQLINNDFSMEETIMIYTHLIFILPKPINFNIIFEKGSLFLEKSLDFFLEAINAKYSDASFFHNLVKFSEFIDVEPKMIECFLCFKEQIFNKNLSLYSYIFKGLGKNIFTFSLSLQFWNIIFKKSINDEFYYSLALEVLQEVIKVVVTKKEDECTSIKIEDLETDIIFLLGLISQNYQNVNHLFLSKFINDIPKKYAIILLKGNKNRSMLPLTSTFFKSFALFLDNDPSCVNLLLNLDLNDKDACKLIGQIVRRFPVDRILLINLLNLLRKHSFTEEAIANVILKLEDYSLIKELFSEKMDLKKCIILFYFLKYKPTVVSNEINKFLFYFLNEKPFDRAFSIIFLILQNYSVPKEIWEKIYNSLDDYSLKDINYFCTDLLQKINEELQIPFVEKIFFRLSNEWKAQEEEIEVSMATKSFMVVIEGLVMKNLRQENEVQYTNILIEFLKYTDPSILLKIYSFYNRIKFSFDSERMIYHLLLCYNSYEMVDCQNEIISLLIECLKKEDGPSSFAKFSFNFNDLLKISELIKNSSTKRSRMLIKELLADLKGKPLSNLYQPSNRIQAQNLFINGKKKAEESYEDLFG